MTDDERLLARAARLATPIAIEEPDDGRSAIVVMIVGQQYAFALADVRRVSILGPITALPHVPPIVLGLATTDGDVRAVFDGRVWAGGARRTVMENTPVLILGTALAPLVLAIDSFAGSMILSSHKPPAGAPAATWLHGVTEDGVLVVDVQALLRDPAFSTASATGPRAFEGHTP